jgi:hypothetical protein
LAREALGPPPMYQPELWAAAWPLASSAASAAAARIEDFLSI